MPFLAKFSRIYQITDLKPVQIRKWAPRDPFQGPGRLFYLFPYLIRSSLHQVWRATMRPFLKIFDT